MSTINQLSAVDSLNAGDNVPVFATGQGDTRRFSLTTLVSFLSTAFTSFTVSSYIKTTPVTFANLPSAASAGAGARAMISDATATTFHSVAAGGGANMVPVFVDNGQWRIG
jgi:hypothetical protein